MIQTDKTRLYLVALRIVLFYKFSTSFCYIETHGLAISAQKYQKD